MKFSQSHQMRYAIIVVWSTFNLFFSVRYEPLFCAVLCVKKRRRKTVLILRFDPTKFSRNEIKREHTKSEVNYRTSYIKKNFGLYFWFVICDFEIFYFSNWRSLRLERIPVRNIALVCFTNRIFLSLFLFLLLIICRYRDDALCWSDR